MNPNAKAWELSYIGAVVLLGLTALQVLFSVVGALATMTMAPSAANHYEPSAAFEAWLAVSKWSHYGLTLITVVALVMMMQAPREAKGKGQLLIATLATVGSFLTLVLFDAAMSVLTMAATPIVVRSMLVFLGALLNLGATIFTVLGAAGLTRSAGGRAAEGAGLAAIVLALPTVFQSLARSFGGSGYLFNGSIPWLTVKVIAIGSLCATIFVLLQCARAMKSPMPAQQSGAFPFAR